MIDEEQQKEQQEDNPDQEAEDEVKALEEDPPQNLEDWPDGKAKYKTLGGADGETAYHEGPTVNLGSSDVRHHEDGSVSVEGEKVDNPEEYKGDPIPGGPTDPDAAKLSGERDLTDKEGSGSADDEEGTERADDD